MAFRAWFVPCLFCLGSAIATSQDTAPIVQPGAPGVNGKTLPPSAAGTPSREPSTADTEFMQGMIMHHGQAVEMVALMAARTKNKQLLSFGTRIRISQSDEMRFMKQWLEERGKPFEMKMDHSKMDHSKMVNGKMPPMMMPGMLTPEQMKALAAATGPRFDHLFLTGMIQHHGGALTMVDDLMKVPGAGQDAQLYDFATDIDNTQRAEIAIMQGMLAKEKK